MQRIYINDRFDLIYDKWSNKCLIEKYISEKTNQQEERVYCGYHWHFEYLLNAFKKKRLDEKTATTVKGTLKALAEIENEIEQLNKQIGEALDKHFQEGIK